MKQFFLYRVLILALALFLLPLGLAAFQFLSHTINEASHAKSHAKSQEPQKLTHPEAPFKGTDLEVFDMEAATTAEIVFKAFKAGYPEKISEYGYDAAAQDWFIMVGEKKFLWAKGRILLEDEASQAEQWRHYIDYLYPTELVPPESFSTELIAEIKRTSDSDYRTSQKTYNLEFYHALYDGKTRSQLEQHIVSLRFLGKKVNLHEDLAAPLAAVEKEIRAAATNNQEVQDFVNKISSVEGYNWREIRDRQDRSFHSWGLAVDILPKGWQQKNIYWSWISEWNHNWMLIPLDRRWMPPQPVVDIFEKHGFVWGGKWLQWDNIHFEYRPELLYLQEHH